MKHANREMELMLTVNRALAYKLSGDADTTNRLVAAEDWTATQDKFRLAEAVLTERWDDILKFMDAIGPEGAIRSIDYRDWPLFYLVRSDQRFQDKFEAIFGESFAVKAVVEPRSQKANGTDKLLDATTDDAATQIEEKDSPWDPIIDIDVLGTEDEESTAGDEAKLG
jgi:hypothetical protein